MCQLCSLDLHDLIKYYLPTFFHFLNHFSNCIFPIFTIIIFQTLFTRFIRVFHLSFASQCALGMVWYVSWDSYPIFAKRILDLIETKPVLVVAIKMQQPEINQRHICMEIFWIWMYPFGRPKMGVGGAWEVCAL